MARRVIYVRNFSENLIDSFGGGPYDAVKAIPVKEGVVSMKRGVSDAAGRAFDATDDFFDPGKTVKRIKSDKVSDRIKGAISAGATALSFIPGIPFIPGYMAGGDVVRRISKSEKMDFPSVRKAFYDSLVSRVAAIKDAVAELGDSGRRLAVPLANMTRALAKKRRAADSQASASADTGGAS